MSAVVPYIASRTTDVGPRHSQLTVEFTAAGPRLAYKDKRPGDRDHYGNLWFRSTATPGNGRVQYDCMHPDRQRECMEGMLCQICGGQADRTRQGWLFLDWRRPESPATWPERSVTGMPPLCAECVRVSVKLCPFLRRSDFAVVRARKANLWGVSGTLYQLTERGWVADETDTLIPYGRPQHRGMLASRLHRELRGVTVVGLP